MRSSATKNASRESILIYFFLDLSRCQQKNEKQQIGRKMSLKKFLKSSSIIFCCCLVATQRRATTRGEEEGRTAGERCGRVQLLPANWMTEVQLVI
jgi:hypothetical protein